MATTSDGIWTPDQGDDYNLVGDLGTMASTIQGALDTRANTYRGTTSDRSAFTNTAPEGTIWVDTNGSKEVWVKQGNAWQLIWPVPDDAGSVTPVGGVTGSISWKIAGPVIQVIYDLSGTITADTLVGTLPAQVPAAPFFPGSEYTYGVSGQRPAYMNGGRDLRLPGQPGVTRRRGGMVWLA